MHNYHRGDNYATVEILQRLQRGKEQGLGTYFQVRNQPASCGSQAAIRKNGFTLLQLRGRERID